MPPPSSWGMPPAGDMYSPFGAHSPPHGAAPAAAAATGNNDAVTYEGRIGNGVFGEVFKAKYRGQEVAAKVTQCPSGFRDEELTCLRRAQGAHAVRLLGEEKATPKGTAILMELCEENVQQRIERHQKSGRAVTVEDFLHDVEDILQGLVWLHNQEIIFGDLKPDNLLITKEGRLVFADFGDARDVSSCTPHNRAVHEMGWGSPMYHARPDVMSQSLTYASDIWMFAQTAIHLWSREEARCNPSPLPSDIPLLNSLRACFLSNPSQRPTAAQLLEECATLRQELHSQSSSPSHHNIYGDHSINSNRQERSRSSTPERSPTTSSSPERHHEASPPSMPSVWGRAGGRRGSVESILHFPGEFVNEGMHMAPPFMPEWGVEAGVADWEMAGFFPPSPPHFW